MEKSSIGDLMILRAGMVPLIHKVYSGAWEAYAHDSPPSKPVHARGQLCTSGFSRSVVCRDVGMGGKTRFYMDHRLTVVMYMLFVPIERNRLLDRHPEKVEVPGYRTSRVENFPMMLISRCFAPYFGFDSNVEQRGHYSSSTGKPDYRDKELITLVTFRNIKLLTEFDLETLIALAKGRLGEGLVLELRSDLSFEYTSWVSAYTTVLRR
ncbi:hypothetical protein R1sor_023566 [Riccia sorocarpa]|uniref:LAGLIDADG homing endonuclease n=1 Tax=Riccia sorocarpa TaxID=122646 RepID=A0ABD3GN08_9MARC